MSEIRIATFNIRTSTGLDGCDSWCFRKEACASTIRALGADVVLLQEVRPGQLRFLRRRFPDYEIVAAGRGSRTNRGEMVAIAVKSVRVGSPPESTVRWFAADPNRPGRWSGARVNRVVLSVVVDGQRYACVHLDEAPNPNLSRCIEAMTGWFDPTTIIGGDFNCRIDDPALRPFWSRGYRDALGHLPADGVGCASHHRFNGSRDGTRIDHLLVPEHSTVLDAQIFHKDSPGLPSDHWPVVATLTVSTDAVD